MVTVVIITRDRARDLERTLVRLQALLERPHVIVVDNARAGLLAAIGGLPWVLRDRAAVDAALQRLLGHIRLYA